MPPAAVLGPVVLPLIAAAVIAVFGLAGTNLGRVAAAVGAWGSAAALVVAWLPVRSSLELLLGQLGYGSSLDLRIDSVSIAFGLMIVVPAALLLTLQPRTWPEAAISLLAVAAAMAAVEAGGVVLTAIAGGTAATLAVILLDTEDPRASRPSWSMLLAGWLALSWVGVVLQVDGGTAVYSAVPLVAVAGIVRLGTASALVACLALLPDRAGIAPLVTIAAAVGLPPGIVFGARVIGIEATFEAGDFLGLIGVASAAVWATWMVGGARAIGLPGGRGHPLNETFPRVSMLVAALTMVAGPALAAIHLGFANPVAAEVMPSSAGSLSGGLTSVITVSSVLPAVTLFVPLLGLAVLLYAVTSMSAIRTQALPAIFQLPASGALDRARAAIRAATVPEQYRSILSMRELESAAAGGSPVLWLAALLALVFAVTR